MKLKWYINLNIKFSLHTSIYYRTLKNYTPSKDLIKKLENFDKKLVNEKILEELIPRKFQI